MKITKKKNINNFKKTKKAKKVGGSTKKSSYNKLCSLCLNEPYFYFIQDKGGV